MKTGRSDGFRLGAAGVLVAGLLFGGCANNQAMDELRDTNRSLTERNTELQRDLQQTQNEIALLQRERAAREAAIGEQANQINQLKGLLDERGTALRDFEGRLQRIQLAPLDEATTAALAELAAKYPDLITFDASRGMLRFSSDLTFDSGQDVVKEGARQSLAALANILTGGAAAQYEVLIVGHTDSQPVSAPTIDRGHKTNMLLSCHRAIAVRKALVDLGVPAEKIQAAGWGEHRPAVPNTATGNTPANRRVEIFLRAASLGEPAAAAPDREAPPGRQPDITK